MRVPLLSGTYQAEGFIANAQECVNLYPEANPPETSPPTQVTHYQRAGLTELQEAEESIWRGLYFATNNRLYGVCGGTLYAINSAWGLKALGSVNNLTTPVAMIDNGLVLVVVDGSAQGWTYTFSTGVFAPLVDAAFYGSTTLGYVDTFLIFNQPDTKNFYSSLSNSITFDPTYIAAKTRFPDLLQGVATVHGEIWLLGQQTTEIWYNSGAADFPFAIIPGTFIEQGCIAKYSISKHDLNVFWLSRDKTGKAIVMIGANYRAERISTHAIENSISDYPVIEDAIGFVYQQKGHVFYVLTFPSADATWVFDVTTKQWHQQTWSDDSGYPHRIRANCATWAYGVNICGDWENGKLYKIDPDVYQDNGQPIIYTRGFPHIVDDGDRVIYRQFSADIECGNIPANADVNQILTLSCSDDRGKSYWNPPTQTIGATGEYIAQPQWQRLGLARDRVFKLSWSINAKTALQGAWVETVKEAS